MEQPRYSNDSFGNGPDSDSSTRPLHDSVSMLLSAGRHKPSMPHMDPYWDSNLNAPRFLMGRTTSKDADIPRSVPTQPSTPRQNGARKHEFVFIGENPEKRRPAGQLTVIRRAAMDHYLWVHDDKDPRAKRKRQPSHTTNATQTISLDERTKKQRSSAISSRQNRHSTGSIATVKDTAFEKLSTPARSQTTMPQDIYGVVDFRRPDILYSPRYTAANITFYQAEPMKEMQFATSTLDGHINQFNEWPEFPLQVQELERLKWYCMSLQDSGASEHSLIAFITGSCRFGSRGLSQHWYPALLASPDAFYSTICISAAHDELMEKEFQMRSPRQLHESKQRISVRESVIKMINKSMSPTMPKDGTMIAVLHVLYSELIGGSRHDIDMHRAGLELMVEARGGLDRLGVNGQLAATMTLVMYLIACLFESTVTPIFVAHAEAKQTEPPQREDNLLASPIYTSSEFCSMRTPQWEDSALYILELTRQATNAFFTMHGIHNLREDRRRDSIVAAKQQLTMSHNGLWSFSSADGEMTHQTGTLEFIRLTSHIFVRALKLSVPISAAAMDLQATEQPRLTGNTPQEPHVLIKMKQALKASPFEDCWKTKCNVLLWCGMVALTVASNGSVAQEVQRGTTEGLRDARDFIAVVTLRTAILGMFERPHATLGMLKRFLQIQAVLKDNSEVERARLRPAVTQTLQETSWETVGADMGLYDEYLQESASDDYSI